MGPLMKKLLLIMVALSLAVFGLAGCATAEPEEHGHGHEGVDGAIHELEEHFGTFYMLGSDAPLADVQAVLADIDASWTELTAAAEDDAEHDITAASIAYDAMSTAAAALTEEAPMPTIEPFVGAFKGEIETLHDTGDFH